MKEITGGQTPGEHRQAAYRKEYRQVVEAEERADYRMLDAAKLREEDMVVHMEDPRHPRPRPAEPAWGWAVEYEARSELAALFERYKVTPFDHAACHVNYLAAVLKIMFENKLACQALAAVLGSRKGGGGDTAVTTLAATLDWATPELERLANNPVAATKIQLPPKGGPSGK